MRRAIACHAQGYSGTQAEASWEGNCIGIIRYSSSPLAFSPPVVFMSDSQLRRVAASADAVPSPSAVASAGASGWKGQKTAGEFAKVHNNVTCSVFMAFSPSSRYL